MLKPSPSQSMAELRGKSEDPRAVDWGDGELSDFSCASALIREAVVASLSTGSSFMNFMLNNSFLTAGFLKFGVVWQCLAC